MKTMTDDRDEEPIDITGGVDDQHGSSPEDRERQRLLDGLVEEMLPHVPFDGWSRRAVHAAADAIDMDRTYADALMANLPGDALVAFSGWADRQMLAAWSAEAADAADGKLRERVARIVLLRFEAVAFHRDAVRRAAALLSLPTQAALSTRLMSATVDRIWHAAGDRSTDFSYYTKRLSLAAALAATTLYWLNDKSDDHVDTAAFLERRIDGILRSGRLVSRLGRFGDLAEAPFRMAARLQRGAGR